MRQDATASDPRKAAIVRLLPSWPRRSQLGLVVTIAVAVGLIVPVAASAVVPRTRVRSDTFTNPSSQHRTIVEPDTFSFGSTTVAAVQMGRFFDGGASDVGFATTTNNGASWTGARLPGITK